MILLEKTVSIIVIAEFVIGSTANVFIALVNFIDWIKRRKFSLVDRILTALAISRIGLLWAILMNWYSIVFHATKCSEKISLIGHISWAITNHFSTWLATILSIFYLFKIANFSSLPFLHLKKRAENVLLVVLLGTLLFLASHFVMMNLNKTVRMSKYEGNVTWNNKLKDDTTTISNIVIFCLTSTLPFITSLICVLLLIYSLCKHLRNMKLHSKGRQDPSAVVHKKALQNVVSFVLLYATYSVSVNLAGWRVNDPPNETIFFYCLATGAIYPSSHSCILIWGNQKLKQTLLLFLWQVRRWLSEWKSSSL